MMDIRSSQKYHLSHIDQVEKLSAINLRDTTIAQAEGNKNAYVCQETKSTSLELLLHTLTFKSYPSPVRLLRRDTLQKI